MRRWVVPLAAALAVAAGFVWSAGSAAGPAMTIAQLPAAPAGPAGCAASDGRVSPVPLEDPGMPPEVLAEYREAHPTVPVDVLYARLMLSLPQHLLLEKWGSEYRGRLRGSRFDYETGVWWIVAADQETADSLAAQARAEGIEPCAVVVPMDQPRPEFVVRDVPFPTP